MMTRTIIAVLSWREPSAAGLPCGGAEAADKSMIRWSGKRKLRADCGGLALSCRGTPPLIRYPTPARRPARPADQGRFLFSADFRGEEFVNHLTNVLRGN